MTTTLEKPTVTEKLDTQVADALIALGVESTSKPAVKPDFGKGRYSVEMERLWESSQKLFGFTSAQAEKFAHQAGSDAGAVFKKSIATIRIGKANSDGKATIADASKVKGVTLTNALHIVRAIQWIDEAEKNSVSYGFTQWTLSIMNENMAKYLASL